MKIRSDFVSNSSSSSFIIGHNEIFDYFHITKQDILDALIDAYGVDAYQQSVERRKQSAKEHPDWYSDNIKYNDYGPIYVYDLSDLNDRSRAIVMWGDLLADWTSTNTHFAPDGHVQIGAEKTRKFEKIVEDMADIYGVNEWDIMSYIKGEADDIPKKFIRSNEKDPETGMYGHYEPLDANVIETIKSMKNNVGYMTNLDVLKCELARFFVHADENELPCSNADDKLDDEGNEIKNPKFVSEAYTYDRVCEIIYKYLVKNGKINPDDPVFMEKMKIDDRYLSAWDKQKGYLWDFVNGKNLSYFDLKYETLTQCMHEG